MALAWRLTSTRALPRRACHRGKGVHTSGHEMWVLQRSRDQQAGAGGRVAREGPSHDSRCRAQENHPRSRRQDRRAIYDCTPPRPQRVATAVSHATSFREDTGRGSAKTPAARATTTSASRGSVSDAKAVEKTGHGLAHWFVVLDRFGAIEKGHTAAARHLYDAHGVDGWYAQGITVAYERARGVRALNQRGDGAYEVSVSKVVAGSAADVIKAFSTNHRRRWTKSVDRHLVRALAAALDGPGSKGFVLRTDGQGRFRYQWDGTTVQFYLLPKTDSK